MTENLIQYVPLFPLLGFIFCGTVGKRMSRTVTGGVATGCVALSFVFALLVFKHLLGLPGEERHLETIVYNWMNIPGAAQGQRSLSLDIAFLVDPLSITLTLIITGVGALIHFYAMGYMSHDTRYSRFFSILNLFVAFMLVLVLGNSFPLMFVGWEGVGLCSYLLIGFWFEDIANAAAGTKAFIANRVGDFGFMSAMLWIFFIVGSLKFADVLTPQSVQAILSASPYAIVGITMLLFLGATGKSAQIPLYVWLPDAMAGPTPVSALIHAATMVTAGVYMVARCHLLFSASPGTQMVIAGIGALTAIMAASIAMVQYDMKKVLAYSTVSQLGYMFIGVGTGAYAAGVFHLFTHAFFKACLFLGAGAVMHGLANRIDMREMGNLKKFMPVTRITYLIAVVAIAGIPPLAGFWSKDDILAAAFDRGGYYLLVYAIGLLTAYMTSLYMFRSYYMAFEGQERIDWAYLKQAATSGGHGHGTDEEGEHHAPSQADHPVSVSDHDKSHLIHEGKGMNFVLIVLAAMSIIAGVFGVSSLFPGTLENLSLERWLEPSVGAHEIAPAANHLLLAAVSAVVALLGWVTAVMQEKQRVLDTAGVPGFLYGPASAKYKVDEAYRAIFQTGGKKLSVWLWQIFDARVIDGAVNGAAGAVGAVGGGLRKWNTGYVRSYAFSILAGVVLILVYLAFHSFAHTGGATSQTARLSSARLGAPQTITSFSGSRLNPSFERRGFRNPDPQPARRPVPLRPKEGLGVVAGARKADNRVAAGTGRAY